MYVIRLLVFEVFCQALTFHQVTISCRGCALSAYLHCGLVINRVSEEDHTLITLSATLLRLVSVLKISLFLCTV